MSEKLAAALHEAAVYGIGATSDFNQQIILLAAQDSERLRAEQFTDAERNRLRQWYNALDDVYSEFLEPGDQDLAAKIVGVVQQQPPGK